MYDAIVIGGGPAGSTTGTLLREQSRRVLILEKSRFPKQKVCGEFLSPAVWPFFDRLGVSGKLLAAGGRKIESVKIFWPGKKPLEAKLPPPFAYALSRNTLDQTLLTEARKRGCEVLENYEVRTIEKKNGTFLIEKKFEAPVLIHASGKGTQGIPGSRQRHFGFKAHFRNIQLGSATDLYFFKGGYLGIVDIEGGLANVCGKVKEGLIREARGNFDRLLEQAGRQNPALNAVMKEAARTTDWTSSGPLAESFKKGYEDGAFYAGDAACFVEPFLGQGMTMAVAGGFLLAGMLDQPGHRYEQTLKELYAPKLKLGGFISAFTDSDFRGAFFFELLSLFPGALNNLLTKTWRAPAVTRKIKLL